MFGSYISSRIYLFFVSGIYKYIELSFEMLNLCPLSFNIMYVEIFIYLSMQAYWPTVDIAHLSFDSLIYIIWDICR